MQVTGIGHQTRPGSNPRSHGVSDGRLGEPSNRQGAALLNQGSDLLNHGIASNAVSGVRLELARRRWQ